MNEIPTVKATEYVPMDVRIFWNGTNATIPDGWERDQLFDGYFLQGSNSSYVGPQNAGGEHNHVADSHNHTGDPHTHTVSGNSATEGTASQISSVKPTATTAARRTHTHSQVSSAEATLTYINRIITLVETESIPPHIDVIVIKPKNSTLQIPNSSIVLTDQNASIEGFVLYDFDERFISGTTFDFGGSIAGSSTHIHTTVPHNHTVTNFPDHSHATSNVGPASVYSAQTIFPATEFVVNNVHHRVGLQAEAVSGTSDATEGTQEASSIPEYVKLMGLQNNGSEALPDGIIVAFVGNYSDIPSGWEFVNATKDRWVRLTTNGSELNETGGNNTHTHFLPHGHTHDTSHTHNSIETDIAGGHYVTFGVSNFVAASHTHDHSYNIGNTTPTMQDTNISMSFNDSRASYRTVIFIRKVAAPTDSCTYTSGDWEVQCSDDCVISSDVEMDGSTLILNGTGAIFLEANITNASRIDFVDDTYFCRLVINSPYRMEVIP